jgi:four helix bundle protein
MAKLNSFRELMVWQKAMSLAERCYRATRPFRRDDQAVLGFEIRKSCISIPSNIAEGFGRHHTAEYVHHLRYANASGNELQTQLELGARMSLIGADEGAILIRDAEEVGRMLNGLIASLERGSRG